MLFSDIIKWNIDPSGNTFKWIQSPSIDFRKHIFKGQSFVCVCLMWKTENFNNRPKI